jgi:catechol 2,3-dioxygenase-like lactoylglutathione lyase family enzyme
MLHHISLAVTNLARSAAFYDAALVALGYRRVWANDTAIGYGLADNNDQFAIKLRTHVKVPDDGFHVAFAAPSREAVVAFYQAALAHGGKDHGAPGIHSEYGPNYYAAFVFDPDGYRIEAVIH